MEKERYVIVLRFNNQPFRLQEYLWFKTREDGRLNTGVRV